MKICTPVYYFIILSVISAICYYIYFSKYFMTHSYVFLQDIIANVIITIILAWSMQCMCYGKCNNTVWIIFIIYAILEIIGWGMVNRYHITNPYY